MNLNIVLQKLSEAELTFHTAMVKLKYQRFNPPSVVVGNDQLLPNQETLQSITEYRPYPQREKFTEGFAHGWFL